MFNLFLRGRNYSERPARRQTRSTRRAWRGGDRLSTPRSHRDHHVSYDNPAQIRPSTGPARSGVDSGSDGGAAAVSNVAPQEDRNQSSPEMEILTQDVVPTTTGNDSQIQEPEDDEQGATTNADGSRPLPTIPADLTVSEEPIIIPPDTYDLPSLSGLVDDHTLIDELPPPPPPPTVYENYPPQIKFLGLGQVVLGIACIVCQGVAISLADDERYDSDWLHYIPSGIVCGVYFIICGIVTILSAHYKTKRWIKTSVMMLTLSSVLFCVFLFIMVCVSIALSNKSDRYQCEIIRTVHRTYKRCPLGQPMLIVNVTLMVLSIMMFTISMRLSIQGYKVVLGKKRNRIQCIRTPEGHLVVLNRGPSYSDDQDLIPSMLIRTKSSEILFPMQTEAILKPPPYALDSKGSHAPPPEYREMPPMYTRKPTSRPTKHSETTHTKRDTDTVSPNQPLNRITVHENGAFDDSEIVLSDLRNKSSHTCDKEGSTLNKPSNEEADQGEGSVTQL